MTKESLIKDLLVLGNLYNTNEEIQNAVYERALSIFNLYESEVKNLDIQRVSNNEVAVCLHEWRRPIINADNYQCNKCGVWKEQTDY